MDTVTVVFANGAIVTFIAQEFNEGPQYDASATISKYAYKDAQGKDSAVYLKPAEVSGIFVTQIADGERHAVTTKVPGYSK